MSSPFLALGIPIAHFSSTFLHSALRICTLVRRFPTGGRKMNLLSDTNIHFENKKASRLFFAYIWIMYAVVYMTKNCFAGSLAAIVAEGSLTLTQTTWISSAFYIAYTPLQILGGVFADKYNPEKLIIIGLLGSAVSNIVIFFNQNFWVMLSAWVFSAIIQFALWPAVYKIITSQLVRSDRSKMIFFVSFSGSGGLILTYAISAFIPKWQYNFIISTISLVLLAIVLFLFCKRFGPIMIKDRISVSTVNEKSKLLSGKTLKIFLCSGFFALLPAVLIRTMVENGTKTLSATMLSQSYESISPTIGNLLNILIILAGMAGGILLKCLLFPKIIKNELVCHLFLFAITLPFAVLLRFVGALPVWLIVLSLCMTSLLLTATGLLTQYFNMHFVPYGLNGTAAGVLNSAASLGMVLQYCVFGQVAEMLGWPIVTTIWIVMILLGMFSIVFGIRPSIRFIQELRNENKEKNA